MAGVIFGASKIRTPPSDDEVHDSFSTMIERARDLKKKPQKIGLLSSPRFFTAIINRVHRQRRADADDLHEVSS